MPRRMASRDRERRRALPVLTRPVTREDCKGGIRPCPFVSCRHNLALDVDGRNVRVIFPDDNGEPDLFAMPETCALDVADRARDELMVQGAEETPHKDIARYMGLKLPEVKELEAEALAKGKRMRAMFEEEDGSLDLARLTDTGHDSLTYYE